jgi:hypothetical protein
MRPDIETDAMKTVVASAIELGAWFEEAESMVVERSASALTAEELDLLAPPPPAPHMPWVVPLSVRPDDETAGIEAADEVESPAGNCPTLERGRSP